MHTTTSRIAPRTILALAATFISGARTLAQDLLPKAPPQTTAIVLTGATVHPVSGPAIPRGVVVFNEGLLRAVMSVDDWEKAQQQMLWAAPPRVIDVSGRHIYPGLIAPYTQLGLTEVQAVAATNDFNETGGITPEVRGVVAVNPDSTLLPVTRRSGILSAGVFPGGGTFGGRAGVIRMDGWTTTDLTIDDDIGVVLDWPNVRPISAWWMSSSEDEQRTRIRENLAKIRTTIETARAYAVQRAMDGSTPVDLRWEAMRGLFVMPADAQGEPKPAAPQQPLFILAQAADQIESAVSFCVEQNLRCVIVGGREADVVAPLLVQHKIPVIIRGVQSMPRRDDSAYDEPFTLPNRLAQAGVTFAIATNDDTAHERNLPYTVGTAVAYGLDVDTAIRSITLDAARALGVDAQLGSLDVGKRATLIVTTDNPLEVTSDVTMAFIDGREIDLRSKHTELAQKYLERYRQLGDLPRPQGEGQPDGPAKNPPQAKPKMDLTQ